MMTPRQKGFKFAYLKAITEHEGLTLAQFKLLVAVYNATDGDGRHGRVGSQYLADKLHINRRDIRRRLKELEDKGFLLVESVGGGRRSGSGSGWVSSYAVALPGDIWPNNVGTEPPPSDHNVGTETPPKEGTETPPKEGTETPLKEGTEPPPLRVLSDEHQSADGLARAGARPPRPRQQQRVIEEKARTTEAECMAEQQRQLRALSALIGQEMPA